MSFRLETNTVFPVIIPDNAISGGGGAGFSVIAASANINAHFGDLINGDASGGAFTVSLPLASSAVGINNALVVKSEVASQFAITVAPAGGDTIDGATSIILPPKTYLYLVSDGISDWIAISYNKSFELDVTNFPGADLGAQFLAADAFLFNIGATMGTLRVPDGDYTWSTHITGANPILPNRKIIFGSGTITCIGANPFFFPYEGPMMALSSNTTVTGAGDATIFDEPDSGVVFVPLSTAENVTLSRFRIQNIANGDPLQLGSSLPNIGDDNAKNVTVDQITFKNTRSLSFSAGGDSTFGLHSDGVYVHRCTCDGVKTITIAAVNAKNFSYDHNTFRNVGTEGPNAPYSGIVCFDVEPNILTDLAERFAISDNIFDLTNNTGGSAILVQGAGVGHDGMVADNVIQCGTDAGAGPTTGIVVNGQTRVHVCDNNVIGQFSQDPIVVNGGSYNSIYDNIIESSGGPPAFRCILITGPAVGTVVHGNTLIVTNTDAGWAAITDDPTCSDTHVFNNILISGTLATTPPTIILGGTNSRQYNNVLNGVFVPGDVTYKRMFDPVPIAVAFPPATQAGDFSTAYKFYFTDSPGEITGIRFYWDGAGGPFTVRCRLYDNAGAVLATVDVAVNAAGVYTGLFATAVATTTFTVYWTSMYETTGAFNQRGIAALATTPVPPAFVGNGMIFLDSGFAAGDNGGTAAITSALPNIIYPVVPIYSIPGAY